MKINHDQDWNLNSVQGQKETKLQWNSESLKNGTKKSRSNDDMNGKNTDVKNRFVIITAETLLKGGVLSIPSGQGGDYNTIFDKKVETSSNNDKNNNIGNGSRFSIYNYNYCNGSRLSVNANDDDINDGDDDNHVGDNDDDDVDAVSVDCNDISDGNVVSDMDDIDDDINNITDDGTVLNGQKALHSNILLAQSREIDNGDIDNDIIDSNERQIDITTQTTTNIPTAAATNELEGKSEFNLVKSFVSTMQINKDDAYSFGQSKKKESDTINVEPAFMMPREISVNPGVMMSILDDINDTVEGQEGNNETMLTDDDSSDDSDDDSSSDDSSSDDSGDDSDSSVSVYETNDNDVYGEVDKQLDCNDINIGENKTGEGEPDSNSKHSKNISAKHSRNSSMNGSQSGRININNINYINVLKYEFDLFWQKLKISQRHKCEYYDKLSNMGYNCISLIPHFTQDMLKIDIGMNTIHCQAFWDLIKLWKQEKNDFLQWLVQLNLHDEYYLLFKKSGILTFESFHRYLNWDSQNVDDNGDDQLKKFLHIGANYDCIDRDLNLMMKNAPKGNSTSMNDPVELK